MTLTTRIDLPSPTRPVGGLLQAARPLPSGWERGVTFGGSSCLAPQPWPYCVGENDESPWEKSAQSPGDHAVFEPTGIVQAVECTTMSRDKNQQTASEALAATADYQLGTEMSDGAVTGNPSLADAMNIGSGVTPGAALAELEGAIASGLSGRLGYVHVSWKTLTLLLAEQVIVRDGRSWRTAAGNLVVSSAGYDFSTLHATPEVFASVSAPETRVDVDHAINQTTAYAEQIGLAVFDPCFNVYTEVTS